MRTADPDYTERMLDSLTRRGGQPLPFSIRKGTDVQAYVNHGRWVADCPCNGAELVAPKQEMLCGSCGMKHTVEFPKQRTKIEETLNVRPPHNQNWSVGETVDSLVAENIENGLYPKDL